MSAAEDDDGVEISAPAAIPPSWMMPAEATADSMEHSVQIESMQDDGGIGRFLVPLLLAGVGFAAVFLFFRNATPAVHMQGLKPPAETPAETAPAPNETAAPITAPAAATPPAVAPPTGTPTGTPEPAPAAVADATKKDAVATPASENIGVILTELPVRKKINKLIRKAERQIVAGAYDDAERTLKRARRLDSRYAPVYKALGIARARNDDADGARWAYTKYLKLAPRAKDAADVRRILAE